MRELGRAQFLTGRPDLAIATWRESLASTEGAWAWSTEDLLVDALTKQGRGDEIVELLSNRLKRLRDLRGDDEPLIARTRRLLGLHYQKQGQEAEAERQLAESLAQLRKTHAEDNWEIGRAKSDLATCLVARGSYPEAEVLLAEAYKTLGDDVRKGGPGRRVVDSLLETRKRLVNLYEAWGRPADAARYRKERP